MLRRIVQAAVLGTTSALAAASADRPPPAPDRRRRPQPAAAVTINRWAAPRPPVVARGLWQPQQQRRVPAAQYGRSVKAVFIHHTDGGNHYRHKDVPDIIRSIYGDHIESRDWDDIGYNFLVDRNGTIYEGRHGGIDRPVIGAHTIGFNLETVGIAAIGTYSTGADVPAAVVDALARIAAWKLGLYGVDPRSRTNLVSTNRESRYPSGTSAPFDAISGHRDAVCTECPGAALYSLLPQIRDRAARLQGRTGRAEPPEEPRAGYHPMWPARQLG